MCCVLTCDLQLFKPYVGGGADAVAELEQILARVESGELGLEESLVKYERGTFLINYCQGILNHAEKQIEQIMGTVDTGDGQ